MTRILLWQGGLSGKQEGQAACQERGFWIQTCVQASVATVYSMAASMISVEHGYFLRFTLHFLECGLC